MIGFHLKLSNQEAWMCFADNEILKNTVVVMLVLVSRWRCDDNDDGGNHGEVMSKQT